jgi:hypothetical protein
VAWNARGDVDRSQKNVPTANGPSAWENARFGKDIAAFEYRKLHPSKSHCRPKCLIFNNEFNPEPSSRLTNGRSFSLAQTDEGSIAPAESSQLSPSEGMV